ncbi:hypothetical protein [Catenuloplanes japonicus]|uniref:hypothetical protein n=1 Tax=Catenuloplanes japonicus TaxID=33876 RepID=UPI0005249EC1|nr:hypothetical protein [Catenuloplanes japonicus]
MAEATAAQKFVLDFAREIVAELAPDEALGLAVLGEGFLQDPDRVLSARVRSGATLGSGIDTQILVLSPIALATAAVVHECLVGEVTRVTARRVARTVKGLRRSTALPGEVTDEARTAAVDGARVLVIDHTGDADLAERYGQVVGLLLERRR